MTPLKLQKGSVRTNQRTRKNATYCRKKKRQAKENRQVTRVCESCVIFMDIVKRLAALCRKVLCRSSVVFIFFHFVFFSLPPHPPPALAPPPPPPPLLPPSSSPFSSSSSCIIISGCSSSRRIVSRNSSSSSSSSIITIITFIIVLIVGLTGPNLSPAVTLSRPREPRAPVSHTYSGFFFSRKKHKVSVYH